jgi:hypothetical protein
MMRFATHQRPSSICQLWIKIDFAGIFCGRCNWRVHWKKLPVAPLKHLGQKIPVSVTWTQVVKTVWSGVSGGHFQPIRYRDCKWFWLIHQSLVIWCNNNMLNMCFNTTGRPSICTSHQTCHRKWMKKYPFMQKGIWLTTIYQTCCYSEEELRITQACQTRESWTENNGQKTTLYSIHQRACARWHSPQIHVTSSRHPGGNQGHGVRY